MTLAERLSEWEREPPPDLYGDAIWRVPAFRLARFLAEVCREDERMLGKYPEMALTTSQLVRSVESVAANIAEGYSRFSGRDRARFYELALGSAREAKEWYRRVRRRLGEAESLERAVILTRIVKILHVAILQDRAGASERRMTRKRLTSSPSGDSPSGDD